MRDLVVNTFEQSINTDLFCGVHEDKHERYTYYYTDYCDGTVERGSIPLQ